MVKNHYYSTKEKKSTVILQKKNCCRMNCKSLNNASETSREGCVPHLQSKLQYAQSQRGKRMGRPRARGDASLGQGHTEGPAGHPGRPSPTQQRGQRGQTDTC